MGGEVPMVRVVLLFLVVLGCRKGTLEPEGEPVDGDGDGFVEGEDCNDADSEAYPGAPERCDGIDNDCDGQIDEPSPDNDFVFYADADRDGFGTEALTLAACEPPDGFVSEAGDCDDTDAAVYPGAPETDCTDPVDYNCDGSVGYADADEDGAPACRDCNDAEAGEVPGGIEICDGLDNDCSGEVDDGAVDAAVAWADTDEDGYGDPDAAIAVCAVPEGYVANGDDCDPEDGDVHPGADERCNLVDDDCDGAIDEGAVDAGTFFLDRDGDGHGDGAVALTACAAPEGWVASGEDCDDANAAAYPGAEEVCDGADNDCDTEVDEAGAVGERSWWADGDEDGYGDPAAEVTACAPPEGHVDNADDCDDASGDRSPETVWYRDRDGDTWGDASRRLVQCLQPDGYVLRAGDCHDGDGAIHPGADEVCNGADDDCDGATDDADTDVVDPPSWYRDVDRDGYGRADDVVQACAGPEGYVDNADDCDDTAADRNPTTPWYRDGDEDGYGDPGEVRFQCLAPTGYVGTAGDCDDTRDDVSPGAPEVCDGVDNDCDRLSDDDDPGVVGQTSWYLDADRDGYGLDGSAVVACDAPGQDWVSRDGDCDDADDTTYLGASAVCDDVDHDCDGAVDFDADLDGWSAGACGGSDCDDADPDVGAPGPEGCPSYPSCLAIRGTVVDVGSGLYTIAHPTLGDISVYCDMDTDGGGWTLVWKHAYLENGAAAPEMRFFSGAHVPCTSPDGAWCNVPGKLDVGIAEMRVRATHDGAVVYDYKGRLNPNLDTSWDGGILESAVRLVDRCGANVGARPEPVSPDATWGSYPGLTWDKANPGNYTRNCDTDAYGSPRTRGLDCRWENCNPSFGNHTQMTMTMWVR